MNDTHEQALTPLVELNLPDSLADLCRERQIVTAEQAMELLQRLLDMAEPERTGYTVEQLHKWQQVLSGSVATRGTPPQGWTPDPHPAQGVLPPAEMRQDAQPLRGQQPLSSHLQDQPPEEDP